MKQCFYIIAHLENNNLSIDKVFLQEYEAVHWGRVLATKNPKYTVVLYKQNIARTSTVEYVKQLTPYK